MNYRLPFLLILSTSSISLAAAANPSTEKSPTSSENLMLNYYKKLSTRYDTFQKYLMRKEEEMNQRKREQGNNYVATEDDKAISAMKDIYINSANLVGQKIVKLGRESANQSKRITLQIILGIILIAITSILSIAIWENIRKEKKGKKSETALIRTT